MKIYVGTYNKYNNGKLAGAWLDLEDYTDKSDFLTACRELHSDEQDPELMFQDSEGIPDRYISESSIDWDGLVAYSEIVQEHGQEVAEALADFGADLESVEYVVHPRDSRNYETAIGYIVTEFMEIPKHLENYIDYEAIGRDHSINGTWLETRDHIIEVIN